MEGDAKMKYKVTLCPAKPKENSVLLQTYYTEVKSLDDLHDALSFLSESGFYIVSVDEVSEELIP